MRLFEGAACLIGCRWGRKMGCWAGGVAVFVPCSALLCALAGPFGPGDVVRIELKTERHRTGRGVSVAVADESSK